MRVHPPILAVDPRLPLVLQVSDHLLHLAFGKKRPVIDQDLRDVAPEALPVAPLVAPDDQVGDRRVVDLDVVDHRIDGASAAIPIGWNAEVRLLVVGRLRGIRTQGPLPAHGAGLRGGPLPDDENHPAAGTLAYEAFHGHFLAAGESHHRSAIHAVGNDRGPLPA
jgi:hypothetical protein